MDKEAEMERAEGEERQDLAEVWASLAEVPFAGETERSAEETPETRFRVNPEKFPIFSQQGEWVYSKYDRDYHDERLSVDETLGRMVGATAETIATISGENPQIPKADHVVYLDKSARPVSWLVDEFWKDFSDEEQPPKTFLAIDRRVWLRKYHKDGYDIVEDGETATPFAVGPEGGAGVMANATHFDITKVPKEVLAGIRALYIDGGVETEDPDEIFQMPTELDGKNLTIIDEVKTSGATLEISKQLLQAAVPELKSVSGHVFWHSAPGKVDGKGGAQSGKAPVWYPKDHKDWRGRGVKDINPEYFERLYEQNPTPENRALKMGSFVLGEPLDDLSSESEPGQPSLHLQEEIHRMREEYERGHILPNMPTTTDGEVSDRLFEAMEELGVEFVPADKAGKNPRAYINLLKSRNNRSE